MSLNVAFRVSCLNTDYFCGFLMLFCLVCIYIYFYLYYCLFIGTFLSRYGAVSESDCNRCVPGFYCPDWGQSSVEILCPEGWFCSAGSVTGHEPGRLLDSAIQLLDSDDYGNV